jgi:hypothetical protein
MPPDPPDNPPPPGGWGQQPPLPPQQPQQPPQPQPPSFGGPPPGYAPAPGPKSGISSGAKALIALVVLVIVGAGAFFLLSGDDDGGSPEQAVREFFAAAQAQDCDRLIELVTDASWSNSGEHDRDEALAACVEEGGFFPENASLTRVDVTEQSGDTAAVEATTKIGNGDPVTETLTVVKENGRWVLDLTDGNDTATSDGVGG